MRARAILHHLLRYFWLQFFSKSNSKVMNFWQSFFFFGDCTEGIIDGHNYVPEDGCRHQQKWFGLSNIFPQKKKRRAEISFGAWSLRGIFLARLPKRLCPLFGGEWVRGHSITVNFGAHSMALFPSDQNRPSCSKDKTWPIITPTRDQVS